MNFLRKGALIAGLVLFGINASLLVLEIGLRIVTSIAPTPERWTDRPAFYFQAEGSETLQDYPRSTQKAEGVFRIAVVGDSYSFAPYMQFTDAFPKVLERMLNLNTGVRRAEVINYGVPAYSTSHEVAAVTQAVQEGADLVLLQFTLNDAELKPYVPIGITQFGSFGPFAPQGWTKTLFSYWKSGRLVAERLHNEATRREYVDYFLGLFDQPRSWDVFEKSVRQIHRVTTGKKVPLVGVVFPLFGVPLDQRYPFHPIHQKIGNLLETLNVPSLDLFETYRGIPLDRLQVMPNEDRHPNEIAHRMAAEKIYSWLAQTDRLPEELRIRKRFVKRTQIIREAPYEGP